MVNRDDCGCASMCELRCGPSIWQEIRALVRYWAAMVPVVARYVVNRGRWP